MNGKAAAVAPGINGWTEDEVLGLITEMRMFTPPGTDAHVRAAIVLGWCPCGQCRHVPSEAPA